MVTFSKRAAAVLTAHLSPSHGGDLGDGDAGLVRLGRQGRQVLVGELAATPLQQLLAGTCGDEHPDCSSLVDPVGHELVQPLAAVAGLMGWKAATPLDEGVVDDRVLQLEGSTWHVSAISGSETE
jgi:hypothetical protein